MGEKEEDVQYVKDKGNKISIIVHLLTEQFRVDNKVMTLKQPTLVLSQFTFEGISLKHIAFVEVQKRGYSLENVIRWF